ADVDAAPARRRGLARWTGGPGAARAARRGRPRRTGSGLVAARTPPLPPPPGPRGPPRPFRAVPVLGARRRPPPALDEHVRARARREDPHLRRPAAPRRLQPVLAAPEDRRPACRGRRTPAAHGPRPGVPRRGDGRDPARDGVVVRRAIPARFRAQPGLPGR